ncbi:MAG: flagellar biosynthetic protein FliO [Wigglesworthia glossinidia]|nr:flagellar biosynthetic protein FliO [Wigglesworthia glossinidia]
MNQYIFFSNFSDLLKITATLSSIILLIFAMFKLCDYFGLIKTYNNKHPYIKIKNSISLGNRERIIILQIDKKCIVVGVTPNCINYLYTISNKKNNIKLHTKSKIFKDHNATTK